MKEINNSLCFMHKLGLTHRDLKIENVSIQNSDQTETYCKLVNKQFILKTIVASDKAKKLSSSILIKNSNIVIRKNSLEQEYSLYYLYQIIQFTKANDMPSSSSLFSNTQSSTTSFNALSPAPAPRRARPGAAAGVRLEATPACRERSPDQRAAVARHAREHAG
jgi:serine/threonine protein kinase